MNDQPEALRIAYVIEGGWDREHGRKAAAELRRLHEANEAFAKRQKWWNDRMFEMENAIQMESALIAAQHDRITTLEAALRQAVEALKELKAVMPIFPKDGECIIGYKDRYNAAQYQASQSITAAKQSLGEA